MKKTWSLLLLLLVSRLPGAAQVQFNFQTVNEPNASAAFGGTISTADYGDSVIGTYFDASSQAHGFLFDGTNYTQLDAPGSVDTNGATPIYYGTSPLGIAAGVIVGAYTNADGSVHGFSYSNGTYTTLDEPDAYLQTVATGISGGKTVGYYFDINTFVDRGFVFDGSNYTAFDDPVASAAANNTFANGADGANIVGYYQSPASHGFWYNGATYTTVDFPNTTGFSVLTGISGTNLTGFYEDNGGSTHGFLYDGANFTAINYPAALNTYALGIWSNVIVGYYIDNNNQNHGFIATISVGQPPPTTGALQVIIAPAGAVSAGAQWQVDGGAPQISGVTLTNLSLGSHTVAFTTINGWTSPSNQTVNISANVTATVTGNYVQQILLQSGSLQVFLGPAGAVSNGAKWQVDGGLFQTNGGTITNLAIGAHTVSFSAIFGYDTPSNQIVAVTNGLTTTVSYTYPSWVIPPDGLTLLTNGSGATVKKNWPSLLVPGSSYTIQAVPGPGYLFDNWTGGTNLPYSILSLSATFTFTMQPELVLQANFVPNPFPIAQGTYEGLFAPAAGRTQTNSGAFNFVLTKTGSLSGKLRMGSRSVSLTGKLNAEGFAELTSKIRGSSALETTLQVNFNSQSVSGSVSNADGSFVSTLEGAKVIYNAHNPATNEAGHYTFIIAGVTNPAVGPYGSSFGLINIKTTGALILTGTMADGTSISQSSTILAGGYWPLYVPLYSGKGSLQAWVAVTNGVVSSTPFASWINPTNTAKKALYRNGFTNETATLSGGLFVPLNQPLLYLTNATAIFGDGGLPGISTNPLTASSFSQITFSDVSNTMSFTLNPITGLIKGTMINSNVSSQPVPVYGILGPTNAAGYFPAQFTSGSFSLSSP